MTLVCNFWRCPALTSIRFIDGTYTIIRAIAGLRQQSRHWPPTVQGREYALAVAAGATDSTRPRAEARGFEITAAKRSFAACGKLMDKTLRHQA